MRKFIAVMFANEAKAYEGLQALRRLHEEATITVYETVVVERQMDGVVTTKFSSAHDLRHTGVGAVLGAVVGVLGGPIGVLLGATAGGFVGAMDEAVRATVSIDYAEHVAEHLTPESFGVLAVVHEVDPGPIDTRMAELGGTVLRETRRQVVEAMREEQARRAEHESDLEAER